MGTLQAFHTGLGVGQRQSHMPPISEPKFTVQNTRFKPTHFPFQPLPPPNRPAPYRYDLSRLLSAADVQKIKDTGVMVFQTVGDTGDFRGRQQDFVAKMMTEDAIGLPGDKKPAFFYHLGDIVYFAGDVDMYGANFYETYQDYPGFVVSIPGNHDCQPDDPQDGPVNPNKKSLDGWVQNFMSKDPSKLGSLKTNSQRTQMDLPNVYWTFTTPVATVIGLFSNVGEDEGEIHQDQIDWFKGELQAADPKLALIVTVHHPPFSGDQEHSGSSAVDKVLMQSFQATNRYPNLVLSGHVHNYQRFTYKLQGPKGKLEIPYVVAGAGGYTNLGKLKQIKGKYPKPPLAVGGGLTLEQYDQNNFGFLRLQVSKKEILGTYISAPYQVTGPPVSKIVEQFSVDLVKNTVKTLPKRKSAAAGR